MSNDDNDDDNTGEDGKIISLAKEPTMPARYCIHTVLIRATSVKPRWTRGVKDQEKKRDVENECDRNEKIKRIAQTRRRRIYTRLPVHLIRVLTY